MKLDYNSAGNPEYIITDSSTTQLNIYGEPIEGQLTLDAYAQE